MARLADLMLKLSKNSDVADAIGQLTEYMSIVTLGITSSGGALTLPYILKESAKTASSLLKVVKVLLSEDPKSQVQLDPAERADEVFYVLAQRSYLTALNLLETKLSNYIHVEKKHKTFVKLEKFNKLVTEIEYAVTKPDIAEATFSFGWRPDSGPLSLFDSYTKWISMLLYSLGVSKSLVDEAMTDVETHARKLLHTDLVSKSADRTWMVHYQLLDNTATIIDLLKGYSPIVNLDEDQLWNKYLKNLANKPSLPIWGEERYHIGIDKLFVAPTYKYSKYYTDGRLIQEVHDNSIPVKNLLAGLLSHRCPSTEMVFIMGGPGTGKTSLMEVFASDLAKAKNIKVILVPAKQLNPERSLLPEVQNFLRNSGHGSLADLVCCSSDVILAIDGFDELAHATLSTLGNFFQDAHNLVRENCANRLRVVMSGRPTLFSNNDVTIPSGSHVITILPFDNQRVVQWSLNWRSATKGTFDGSIYLHSTSIDLKEIVRQPMLLYLLAKMHEEGAPISHDYNDEGAGRFRIYSEMLDWVCRRQEDKKITTDISARLRRFLQVAGLATHQSGKRILHWSQFTHALEDAGLANDVAAVNSKAYSTILSFAFTNVEERSAWEFTHKSFGEALAAEAIGRILDDISETGRDGERWRVPLPVAAKYWIQTFGPHFVTKDVIDFCNGWLATKNEGYFLNLMPRLLEVFKYLSSSSSSDDLVMVAKRYDKPIALTLGNAIKSWFSFSNMIMNKIAKSKNTMMQSERHKIINHESYRIAVYMSAIVSPISTGEGVMLLKGPSMLVDNIKTHKSPGKIYILNNIIGNLLAETKTSNTNIVTICGKEYPVKDLVKGKLYYYLVDQDCINMNKSISKYFASMSAQSLYLHPIEKAILNIEEELLYSYGGNLLSDLWEETGIEEKDDLTYHELIILVNVIVGHLKNWQVQLPTGIWANSQFYVQQE